MNARPIFNNVRDNKFGEGRSTYMGPNYTVGIFREDIDLFYSRYVFEHYLNPPFLINNCGYTFVLVQSNHLRVI